MCGGNITRVLIPMAAVSVVQPVSVPGTQAGERTTFCPACGAAASPGFAWCPMCGAALKSHPCAYCGSDLAAGESVCPSCGAPDRK
jgi:predicted amidophosphoribosyltransferase